MCVVCVVVCALLFACLLACLFVCLFVCLFIYLFACLLVSSFVSLSFVAISFSFQPPDSSWLWHPPGGVPGGSLAGDDPARVAAHGRRLKCSPPRHQFSLRQPSGRRWWFLFGFPLNPSKGSPKMRNLQMSSFPRDFSGCLDRFQWQTERCFAFFLSASPLGK